MHLLAIPSASLDDNEAAVDLAQTPGDVVGLSFSDSDLSGWARAWTDIGAKTLRLASFSHMQCSAVHDVAHRLIDDWIVAGGEIVGSGCRLLVRGNADLVDLLPLCSQHVKLGDLQRAAIAQTIEVGSGQLRQHSQGHDPRDHHRAQPIRSNR